MKIITIEEAQGIIIIKVKELIRSLQTFEIKINDIIEKKTKSIVFVSHTEENEDNCDAEEIVLDVIALIDRKFHEASKRLDRRCKINVVDKVPDNFKNIGPQRKSKDKDKPIKGKGIKCHEFEGFGHIKDECPTFLKKQKKGMSITWSYYDDESEEQITNKMMTFIGKSESGTEYSHEEITNEELAETYKFLYNQWKESWMVRDK